MDTGIIGSIIGAATTLIATFLTIRANKKLNKQKEAFEKSIEFNSENSQYFSYSLKSQVKEIIMKEDGSATIHSKWLGLKPSQTFIDLKIPYSFRVTGNGVKIEPPEVKELPESELAVEFRDLEINEYSKNHHSCKGKFTVLGKCEPKDCKVSFKSTHRIENAYTTTKQEAIKAYAKSEWSQEFCSAVILVPTDKLQLSMVFPYAINKLSGKPFPIAFANGTFQKLDRETKRIEKNFQKEFDKNVILNIDKPILGVTYAISWMPPSA